MINTKCAVIILNWNGWADTVACLDSLKDSLSDNFVAIVCDNGSSDDSLIKLRSWCSNNVNGGFVELDSLSVISGVECSQAFHVAIIKNGKNLGFAGGNNSGVMFAMSDPNCRFIWLLNNDTVVTKNTLPAALAHMDQNSSIGICGSTLVYFDDRNMVQGFGGAVYSPWTGRSRHIGAFASISEIPATPDLVERQMNYVIGASMLVRREFIEEIGLMEEDYFLYCEEIDWATRGRGHFRLGYAPESVVFHKEGASIGTSASGGSPLSLFYLFRNRVRYGWRFHRAFVLSVLFFCAVDVAKLVVRRRWPQVFAAIRGVLQFSPPQPIANKS